MIIPDELFATWRYYEGRRHLYTQLGFRSYEIGRRREQPLHGSGGSAGEVGPSSVDCNAGDVGIKEGEVVSSSVGCKAGDVGTIAGEGVSSSVGSAGKGRSARSERRRDSAMRRRRSWERGDKRRNHSPIAAADMDGGDNSA